MHSPTRMYQVTSLNIVFSDWYEENQNNRPFSKLLRDLRVVDIWVQLDDLLPLDVGEHHERVHRPLDVVRGVLFRLQIRLCECDCQIMVSIKIRKNSLGNTHFHCKYTNTVPSIYKDMLSFQTVFLRDKMHQRRPLKSLPFWRNGFKALILWW